MAQFGLDAFGKTGWKEENGFQVRCGAYNHVLNEHFSHVCSRCRVAKTKGGELRSFTMRQENCTHEWEDVGNACSLCWAKKVD